jgi:formylglycine-generating enzyme required for sulfatase activity
MFSEWEYAARANTTTDFYWGADSARSCEFGNGANTTPPPDGKERWNAGLACNDGYYYTSPVGHYAPNAFGLHDMLGNAREWTEDCYNDSFDGAPADGSAWLTGNCLRRVARGNSVQGDLRLPARGNGGTLPARNVDFGFRLAQDY